MGAVAELLKAAGHDVRGSDEHVYPPMSTQLRAAGIPVFAGFAAANLDWQPELVVVGNVCRRDHVEVLSAQARGMRLTSFPGVLEELVLPGRPTLVITGTHGKTTTTSLSSWVLTQAGKQPGYMVGGVPINMGRGAALGDSQGPFVIEGDEYDTAFFDKKSKFLHYLPRFAVLTSVELDHVDIFSGLDAIKASFREFVALLPKDGGLWVSARSPTALEVSAGAQCRVERYGLRPGCAPDVEWQAEITATRPGGRTLFNVFYRGALFGSFDTGLPGGYNLENVLSVIAACHGGYGLSADELVRGIRLFAGVKRRQELRGVAQGVAIVDDFAHHPTAISETLRGLRGRHGGGRLLAVMEPRSATSRTAVFQREFADALALADEVVIGAVHMPEKAPAGNRLDIEQLAADVRRHGVPARALPKVEQIVDYLGDRLSAGDTVAIMSSGSFDGLHEKLLARLGDGVTQATLDDVPAIKALLLRVKLPTAGIPEDIAELWLIRDEEAAKDASKERTAVGCVALEIYGETGLLRSLAVHPDRRGEGLGWTLAEIIQLRARQRGLRQICLLTEHATDFFAEKFGYQPIARDELPADVTRSSEFQRNLTDRSVTMRLAL